MQPANEFKSEVRTLLEKISVETSKENDLTTLNEIKSKVDALVLPRLWKSSLKKPGYQILLGISLIFTFLWLAFDHPYLVWESTLASGRTNPCDGHHYYDYLDIFLYLFWVIMPPLYFLYEYNVKFGEDESNILDDKKLADLKYCQDLGAKIWAAVSLIITVLLYIRYGGFK